MSQQKIVQFLVNTNKTLKTTYQCYQGIINWIKENDFNKFKNIVLHKNKSISDKMKQALKLYNENINYIENSFKYDINNGIIEGTNNLIKCIKRIAFGYKRFDHFVTRIFLIKGTLKGWLSSSLIFNSFIKNYCLPTLFDKEPKFQASFICSY
mgnify:FL=1